MTRSLLIDFRSDVPIEMHPQVTALTRQGWMVKNLSMRGTRASGNRASIPKVLVRLVKKRS